MGGKKQKRKGNERKNPHLVALPFLLLLPTPCADYSQILYLYWKSPLRIENRDDTTRQRNKKQFIF